MSRRRRWRRRDAEADGTPEREKTISRVRRGIYIVPTLITLVNFGSGFFSIMAAIDGEFMKACYFIIAAMVADALDGAIARMVGSESAFGKELDSLADIVSFGCAPALLIHLRFGLSKHELWIFPLFFAVAGALRLARYNAVDSNAETKEFRGTPIPAAAGIIVGLVMAFERYDIVLHRTTIGICIFLLGYLMVSNLRYPSLKMLHDPGRPLPFRFLVLILLVCVLLIYRFTLTWLVIGALYYLSGPFFGLRGRTARNAHNERTDLSGIEEENLN